MKRALFIHRSVGRNLIRDGDLYNFIRTHMLPVFDFNDYDHNTGVLTNFDGKKTRLGLRFPGGNTNPENYAALFSDTINEAFQPILDLILTYDVIIIKSCYPNSNIQSDAEREQIKKYYLDIAKFFAKYPKKKLIIMTSPPLVPMRTTPAAAKRARALSDWRGTTNLGKNIHNFDLFHALATPEGEPQANTLRKMFRRRWLPFDSHPNKKGSKAVGQLFVISLHRHMA